MSEILVADDNVINLRVIEAFLTRQGYHVTTARDGRQALAACAGRDFDLLLLDIQMPELDGLAVCRAVKAEPRTAGVPVIFITGALSDDADVVRGLEAGAVDYVAKGIHPTVLLTRVRIAIAAHQARRQQAELAESRAEALRELTAAQALALQARKQRAIATLAAGLAHELNNPLTAALMDVNYVRNHAEAPEEERLDALESAARNLLRMAELVARMSQLSESVSREDRCRVEEVVEATVVPRRELLGRKQIEIAMLLGQTPHLGGAGRMGSVISELITNAARVLPPGGRIEIATRLEATDVVVTVKDDGPGMDAHALEHAFDPFFTTKREWTSIGLGLPMCHSIVTGLGGRIAIDSAPARGTTVEIRLPA